MLLGRRMKSAIIVMAKFPAAGRVKTRLVPFLSAEQSAQLAECFLRDTIDKAKNLKRQLIVAYSPAGQRAFFAALTRSRQAVLVNQIGKDLGERMYFAFKFAFEQNSDSAVLIGTDSPTLPPEFIEQAFDLLRRDADAVLGKTADGGFYLIGLRKLKSEIFENVRWSSEKTFEQTAGNIKNSGFKLKEAPLWYDVDEQADLERLAEEFKQNDAAKNIAPETFEWLKTHKLL